MIFKQVYHYDNVLSPIYGTTLDIGLLSNTKKATLILTLKTRLRWLDRFLPWNHTARIELTRKPRQQNLWVDSGSGSDPSW